MDVRKSDGIHSKKGMPRLQAEQHEPSGLAHCLTVGRNPLDALFCNIRDSGFFLDVDLDILPWLALWYCSDSGATFTEPIDT